MKLINIILVIRILCIGNSFSWDAVEQELVPLCDAKGIQVEVHNLYYGGCSLQQHAEFMLKDTAAYSHRICTNNKSPIRHRQSRVIRDTISLKDALRDGRYEFISFQQASHDSGIRSSYEPWLGILIDTVRAYQPHAQLCWMQTWAYSQDAKHPAYPRYHNNQAEMWDSIRSCTLHVKEIVTRHPSAGHWLLIPCGQAIQLGRSSALGDTFSGGIGLNYNIIPRHFAKICELCAKNDFRAAAKWQAEANRLVDLIIESFADNWSAFKVLMKGVGIDCGFCRAPYAPLTKAHERRLLDRFAKLGVVN